MGRDWVDTVRHGCVTRLCDDTAAARHVCGRTHLLDPVAAVEGEEGDAEGHDEEELDDKPLCDVFEHLEDEVDQRANGWYAIEDSELLEPEEEHARRHHGARLVLILVRVGEDLVACTSTRTWRTRGQLSESGHGARVSGTTDDAYADAWSAGQTRPRHMRKQQGTQAAQKASRGVLSENVVRIRPMNFAKLRESLK